MDCICDCANFIRAPDQCLKVPSLPVSVLVNSVEAGSDTVNFDGGSASAEK
jgi:hypothetical protein